ncbi:MAG: right-handed parallel beta-helix repeat-containing protein [Geminicoccaceae bacterium]
MIDRPNTRIIGCFPRSRLIVRGAGLRFTADATGIEEVVVLGGAELGAVGFEGMSDGFALRCRFEGSDSPLALTANKVRRLTLAGNRLEGAGIGVFGGSREVEIDGNAVERFAASAVLIDESAGEITISGNRLVDGLGAGIEVGKRADRLLIRANEIVMCRGEKTFLGGAVGGIVALDSVDGLIVEDNLIERNASDAPKDAAGIFVARGTGIEIRRNRILGNGRAETDEGAITGGIIVTAVAPPVDQAGARPHRFDPALVVEGNVVTAERGHALLVIGEGDMRVQGNTLISRFGTARGVGPNDLATRDLASVVLIGIERLQALAPKLIEAAANGPQAPLQVIGMADEQRVLAPGRVLVQGNQIALERQLAMGRGRPVLAAVAVYGFEDVDLSHNQVELDRNEASFCVDALVVGRTARQLGNRLTEPERDALASLLSLGFDLNTCTQNQGSHCILPRGFAQLVDRDNLVEFPSDLCPRG